jgi:2-oxoisovalerate ferredoxin oxidoreductase beta subunit
MAAPQILEKPASFFETFSRKSGNQQTTHYCPGCGHGILNKLMAEAIDQLEIQDRTIMVGPVGCSVFLYYYFQTAAVSAPHGRASAVATGVSRVHPEAVTISYQGDGDLAAIGTNNALHAANRGENMIVFFVNNSIYGMTGGQLAPTTLIGQKTTTSPYGRTQTNDGPPLKMSELIASLETPVMVARVGVHSPKHIQQARKVIRRGLQAQKDKKGYVFIEVLSPCPTNWRKKPNEACRWVEEVLMEQFPLGVFKDEIDQRPPVPRMLEDADFPKVSRTVRLEADRKKPSDIAPLPYPEVRLKIAGFGGQGILSLGLFIADSGMKKDLEVTWLPSYGPEMRGGVANCSVVLGTHPIGSPVVSHPNLLVAMNKPSLYKFGPTLTEDGLLIYNSSLIDSVPEGIAGEVFPLAATDLAQQAGNVKAANTVVLGFLSRKTGLFGHQELVGFLRETFSDDAIFEMNCRALDAGWQAAGE